MAVKIKQDDQTTINLTPMIDIVFLLMIFFMVGTKYSELDEAEKNIAINVPQVNSATALTDAPKKKSVNILKDGTIMLDQKVVSLDELFEELVKAKQQYEKSGVVLRGDAESKYQHVASAIATCKRAKVAVNIAVKGTGGGSKLR